MKFKYVGPFDAVEIPGVGRIELGETYNFDPERSEGLKGQDAWEHVPDPKRQKAAKKAAATRADNDDTEDGEA